MVPQIMMKVNDRKVDTMDSIFVVLCETPSLSRQFERSVVDGCRCTTGPEANLPQQDVHRTGSIFAQQRHRTIRGIHDLCAQPRRSLRRYRVGVGGVRAAGTMGICASIGVGTVSDLMGAAGGEVGPLVLYPLLEPPQHGGAV